MGQLEKFKYECFLMMLEEDTCFSTSKNVLWFISKCLLLREQYWSVRLPKWHSGKNSPANVGDTRDAVSIPGSGRYPGEGNGNPLRYSCLENPIDRGGWWATIHRVVKTQTCLSNYHIFQSLKIMLIKIFIMRKD